MKLNHDTMLVSFEMFSALFCKFLDKGTI